MEERSLLEMIAVGAYSPLEGFMDSSNYKSVLTRKRLADGTAWSMPISLAAIEEESGPLSQGADVALFKVRELLSAGELPPVELAKRGL